MSNIVLTCIITLLSEHFSVNPAVPVKEQCYENTIFLKCLFQPSLKPESLSPISEYPEDLPGTGLEGVISSSGNFSRSRCAMCSQTICCQISATYWRRLKKKIGVVLNWYKTSGFTGIFNTENHGAITLVTFMPPHVKPVI